MSSINENRGIAVKLAFTGGRIHAVADMGMLELNEENVELVLDEVRPYLMAGVVPI